MSRAYLTQGLLLVLVLLLLGACSSSGVPCSPAPCDPCAPPGLPVTNPCNWPDYSPSINAREQLAQISTLVQTAFDTDQIDVALKERVDDAVRRCLSPELTNAHGRHVCDLQDPLPCEELREIRERSADPEYPRAKALFDESGNPIPPAPPSPTQHWETIAQELEGFPTGR